MKPRVLCIGQSDPSGVSGLQADLRAVEALGGEPLTVVSAVSVQNSQVVSGLFPVPPDLVRHQIGIVLADGPIHAVKLGALVNAELIDEVGNFLDVLGASDTPVVVDPVIDFRDGVFPLDKNALDAFRRRILLRATVLMPNVREAEGLTGMTIRELGEKEHAAHMMMTLGVRTVIITSGARDRETLDDVLVDEAGHKVYSAEGRPRLTERGAETMLASGMAACMAQGLSARKAYEQLRGDG